MTPPPAPCAPQDVIRETMREKYAQKGEVITEEFFDTVTHEVSTAAMKYALLSCSCTTQISFDIKKVHHACTAPLLTCTPSCSCLRFLLTCAAGHQFRGCLGALHPVQFDSSHVRHSKI